ncbi:MAG: PQQ-dependent sugar dehydrogenase [Pyrinomonadaceae bacterium]
MVIKINLFACRILFLIALLANVACASSPIADAFETKSAEEDRSIFNAPAVTPKFKVETVATNLEVVWSIVFAPDGRTFFTERPGRLRVIENGKLRSETLAVISEVEPSGESGLMGMALHPQFASNHFLYLAYAYQKNGNQHVKVVRYRETGTELIDAKMIVEMIPAARYHAGTRLKFGLDGKLYITTGDATKQSQGQELDTLGGKTLRLNDDGTVPADNPFAGQKGARPEIWTYGHRNAQGMDFQPETGLMFQTEHGPSLIDGVSLFKRSGGDEVNIVERGKNYGWAKISHKTKREGMETPIVEYSPAVAPASGMFYRGNLFPEFKGNFFFGALKGEAIIRLVFEGRKVVSQERLLVKTHGRIREIAEAPDGSIYFSTSNRDGRGDASREDDRILRIVPTD